MVKLNFTVPPRQRLSWRVEDLPKKVSTMETRLDALLSPYETDPLKLEDLKEKILSACYDTIERILKKELQQRERP